MTRTLRVCALQLAAHDRPAYESGAVTLRAAVEDAARDHDLLVLPEATLPAYVLGNDRVDDAMVNAAIEELRTIARSHGCVIVAGAAVRREGSLYNSAIVIDADGTIAGSAEKIFLWHFDRKWFTAGSTIAPIQTRIGRLGVLICADGRMPGIAGALVDRGAELLVMPTAWVTSGRDPKSLENIQADLLARVRAFENGVPFVAANKCGVELQMVAYCGKSQIVAGNGEIVALASQDEAQALSAQLTLAQPSPVRVPHASFARRESPSGTTRVAFSLDRFDDLDERLAILDATECISPDSEDALDARLAFDPHVLAAYRASGQRRVVLTAQQSHPWLERIARARAAELRMYVFVFDRQNDRAYAVDPDGTIIAGTFGAFRVASAAIDYRRTSETMVAPGTDVEAGLTAVSAIAGSEVRA